MATQRTETEMKITPEQAKKSQKQEFLDRNVEKGKDWIIQQMLIGMNKTQMTNALRSVNQIYTVVYKSWAREMPFQEIMDALAIALKLERDGNNMEN